ncbi:hypothetical protein GH733_007199 [Mirounga leonina]|nr:hypothetical protein GH733_007199 [Mirounga leonina]
MPILVCVSKEVSTSWVHRPQLPPFAQGLRGLSIMEILLHFSLGCPHQDPGAILPPFRIRGTASGRRRQSTLLKSNTKPRPSSIPLGCILQLRAWREVWGEGGVGGVDLAGRSPGPSAQTRPPQEKRLCRARDPLGEDGGVLALEPAHAWARRAGAGRGEPGPGAGQRRRPRLQRDPRPAERRGRPVSPGKPAALKRRELSNTSTQRKGNQPALTCKQGLPSEEPAQTDPQAHSLAPRASCNPSICPPQGPPGRGTRAGGGCRSLPRRLRPRPESNLLGGRGGEFTRAGDNLEPTAREDRDADRRKPTIKKMHPVGIFPLGPWAAEGRQTRSGSPVDADSGRFRKDPTVGGAD